MPKRGGGGGNGGFGGGRGNYNSGNGGGGGGSRFSAFNDKMHQHEHDDRLGGGGGGGNGGGDRDRQKERGNSTRRVSFKASQLQSKGGIKSRMAEMAIRSRLEDDEDMGDFASSSKFDDRNHGSRRKGSPIPKGKFGNFRKLIPSAFGWYQVTIQSGHRYSKDDVIRALLGAISPDIFIPQYWRSEKNCVLFFVDDFHIAERLQQIDRSVQMPDGYRLFTRVRTGFPIITIDDAFKEKMKIVMAKRYNAQTHALDLSKFHADPDFKNMFCGLFRPQVMSAAIEIIEKNIPDLVALNLNDNCLASLDGFKNIAERLPHLKILYLGDNKLPALSHLLVLRNVPIVELVLKSNPLRQRYKDQGLYISEVRRKFPKIVKLDGEALEPQILFDVSDTSSLPRAKASFLCDGAGAEIIRQFLEQYFIIFDSDNRQPLLDAYHEQAMLSISLPPASQAGRLGSFWKFNRNFRRIMNNEDVNKFRQLKIGRLAVVSSLAEWPKTQHDPLSFSVDMTLFTPALISFTVAGLFKEFESAAAAASGGGDVRYFQRQFVIVPAGGGFCIRNEMILITSTGGVQARTFLKPPMPATQSPAATTSAAAAAAAAGGLQQRLQQHQPSTSAAAAQMMQPMGQVASPQQPDDATKMQMVQAMSAQSNMNLDWSRKCLEETNWDYQNAAFVFDKLQKESKIPPEAFVK